MIFHPGRCPKCGGKPVSVTDHVLIHSPLEKDEDEEENSIVSADPEPITDEELFAEEEDEAEEIDYADFERQDVLWDTQEIYHFDDGTVMLQCANGHGWSAVDQDPPPGNEEPVPHSYQALADACDEIIACDTLRVIDRGDWATPDWFTRVELAIEAARQARGHPDAACQDRSD